MNDPKPKSYLGDGVYAEIRDGFLVLTTENGISVLNIIYLDPGVLEALLKYLDITPAPSA